MNREIAIKRLKLHLKKHAKNFSQERRIILDAILQYPPKHHFKSEELVRRLKSGPQSVSRATIYRTLTLFEEAGIIRSIPENCDIKPQKSYEISNLDDGHGHLICRSCGRIIEYRSREITEVQNNICQQHNFQPRKYIEIIYGICARCQVSGNIHSH